MSECPPDRSWWEMVTAGVDAYMADMPQGERFDGSGIGMKQAYRAMIDARPLQPDLDSTLRCHVGQKIAEHAIKLACNLAMLTQSTNVNYELTVRRELLYIMRQAKILLTPNTEAEGDG